MFGGCYHRLRVFLERGPCNRSGTKGRVLVLSYDHQRKAKKWCASQPGGSLKKGTQPHVELARLNFSFDRRWVSLEHVNLRIALMFAELLDRLRQDICGNPRRSAHR